MPVGRSRRIVVDFDPELKRQLHARLRSEGRDFKGWLLERVQEYLEGPPEGGGAPRRIEELPANLGEVERRVLDAVSSDGRARYHADDLAQATGLGASETRVALVQLELQGLVVEKLGFYQRVRPC